MQAVSTREPSGALAAELIRPNAKRVPRQTIERFLALEDLSGTISDVLGQARRARRGRHFDPAPHITLLALLEQRSRCAMCRRSSTLLRARRPRRTG